MAWSLQRNKSLNPTKTWQRNLAEAKEASTNASQAVYIDIPRDHFIHEIHVTVYKSTAAGLASGTLADNITSVQIIANGNKYLKDGLGSMFKQVMKINKRKPATGFYLFFFSDPKISDAQPLPAWVFTSLQLKITTTAAGSGLYNFFDVTLVESAYNNEDLSNWHILIEKYLKHQTWGTNTGYQYYEHERAYRVYGYLYAMDDNDTLSATIFDKLKVLGRQPSGEVTIVGEVPIPTLVAMNNGEIAVDTLSTGYCFLEWLQGFPANEFSSLYTYMDIPTAGTNAGLMVLERYTL